MEANWLAIIILVGLALILVAFLVFRNRKDEKGLERFLNENDTPIEDKEEEEPNDSL